MLKHLKPESFLSASDSVCGLGSTFKLQAVFMSAPAFLAAGLSRLLCVCTQALLTRDVYVSWASSISAAYAHRLR